MSKRRGGIKVNFGVKSRHRSIIVLESSPSAEIASYDYEAALSQSELKELHSENNEVETNCIENGLIEKKETTPRDLGKECTPNTVCFPTNNQISGKLTSATNLTTDSPSQQKITQQECAVCKNIVNESGDESGNVNASISDLEELQSGVKNRGRARSARKEKSNTVSPKIKTNLNDLAKRKIVNSSLSDGNKNSKIPRATTITCAAARVCQIACIPSRGNSKTSLCTHSLFATRRKPMNFITESNQAPVKKRCDILEREEGSTISIVDIEPPKLKASRTSLRKEASADEKTDSQPCKELPKSQVGSAGDHPLPLSTTSVRRNLRSNNACRSCNNRRETVNLELSINNVQDPRSDSKSSPEIRSCDPWSK